MLGSEKAGDDQAAGEGGFGLVCRSARGPGLAGGYQIGGGAGLSGEVGSLERSRRLELESSQPRTRKLHFLEKPSI